MIDSLLAGGAERVAVEVACALDRARFEPHVLVTRGDGPLREVLEAADVPFTLLERRGTFDVGAWRRAHRHVRDHADLIHAHKFGSAAWAALLARTTRTPLVTHEHNFSATPSRLRSFISRRWIAPRASSVLCVSDSVADVERANGVPNDKVRLVPNGVRLDAALARADARAELGLTDTGFVVGIVGRLRTEKAHDVLLRAIARSDRAGSDIELCVVGDGPRDAELHALASELGITHRVTWAGERKDAARLASAFDVAVICSHWEGLPLAALEAMSAGVPLIASAVGGLPTLLAGDRGVLTPAGDVDALADAISRLASDRAEAARIGTLGRQRIADEYSFAAMLRAIEHSYHDALHLPHGDAAHTLHTNEEHAA
jgi:glycosyltransferase involved in cell wall biosynthesis